MKRVFSIVMALALALTMLIGATAPAAAVSWVLVLEPEYPLAGQNSTYEILFHNNSALQGGGVDHIDVIFPFGTNLTNVLPVVMLTRCGTATTYSLAAIFNQYNVGTRTVRIFPTADIDKSCMVYLIIGGVTNPKSCYHHIQVGTSTHTPVASADFPVYTAQMFLGIGMNLISLPAYPVDTAIEVVLADLFARKAARAAQGLSPFNFSVWYWDSWTQEWLIYASDTSFSSLTTMEAGKAYFVKVNQAMSFFFKGDAYPKGQGPPIKACYPPSWSMIGPASASDIYASLYLQNAMLPWPAQNTYAVSVIFGFSEATQQFFNTGWNPGQRNDPLWQYVVAPFPANSDYELEATRGYFMSFLGEACIIPPLGP